MQPGMTLRLGIEGRVVINGGGWEKAESKTTRG